MKKAERQEAIKTFAREKFGSNVTVTHYGRHLSLLRNSARMSSRVFLFSYLGALERFSISKTLILNCPEVISDNWIEANKDKFTEDETSLIIKEENKNLPYWGVTPFRLLKRLGLDPRLEAEDGFCHLSFSTSAMGTHAEIKAALPKALQPFFKVTA